MEMITLESSDSKKFEVNRKVVKDFKLLAQMDECLNSDANGETTIPLKKVNSFSLKKLLEWAQHHQSDGTNDPFPTLIHNHNVLATFDKQFIAENDDHLLELIDAANFLGFEPMLEMLCKEVAKQLSTKSTDTIRKENNITEPKTDIN